MARRLSPPLSSTVGIMSMIVRSGAIWSNGRINIWDNTAIGGFWSSRAFLNESYQTAYYLFIGGSHLTHSYRDPRWYGFPLRCLVR